MREQPTPIPPGYCQCGCGERTKPARQTRADRGWVKGEPVRYVNGAHATRKSPVAYVVEDRGFKSPCWVWQRCVDAKGYGYLWSNGRSRAAHIVYWEAENGPVPKGLELDHLCCVPACVRPSHLDAVTHAENVRRGQAGAHWRKKTHCPQGHPYDDENTYLNPSRGYRQCRICLALQRSRR